MPMNVKFNVLKLNNGDVVTTSTFMMCIKYDTDHATEDSVPCTIYYGDSQSVNQTGMYPDVYDAMSDLYGSKLKDDTWYSVYVDEQLDFTSITECKHGGHDSKYGKTAKDD